MKLYLPKPRGFCAGVERAIQTVKRAIELYGPPIYVKHAIVHNRYVVEGLEKRGAIFVENLADVPRGARVVFSAHGVSPQVRQEAEERSLFSIDATCGLVTKVHSAAKRYAAKGYQIVLIGHRSHVEIIGVQGEAPEAIRVVESVQEAQRLDYPPDTPLAYLTQTTLSLDDAAAIVAALKTRYPAIETLPSSSICYATTNRQLALRSILPLVDLVLVVGDPASSNSRRLVETALNRRIPAHLISSPNDIDPAWLSSCQSIGLTSGASTPEELLDACVGALVALGVTAVEEVESIKEEVVFGLPAEVQ
jgi:4-hydroxy-3-methylbut-2-enyl diphosphate reductase